MSIDNCKFQFVAYASAFGQGAFIMPEGGDYP